MENRNGYDRDRKGKKPVETTEFEEYAIWNRLTLEKWQTTILKAAYKISKNPSPEAIWELACMTALTPSQVRIWFGNKGCVRQFEKGESSNSKPQLAVSSTNITRDETLHDVERLVHMPMWQHGRLLNSGVLITYRRQRRRQSSMQQESRIMPVHENQYTRETDINMLANPVNAATVPGEQGLIPREPNSDSDSATESE